MFKTLRSAARLDVVELLPEVSDRDLLERRWAIPRQGWRRLLYRSRLVRALVFFRRAIQAWFRAGEALIAYPKNAILIAAFTTNQCRALAPLHNELNDQKTPTCFLESRKKAGFLRHLDRWSYVLALPFLPVLAARMFSTRGAQRSSFAWGLDRYWQAYGAYVAVRRWLQKQRPRAVVVANDHSFWPRVMVIAAKHEGIPTIYVQHAPVTERFPPLTMDYALLEGRRSLEIYSGIGPSTTRVFLIGMPRLDAYIERVNHNVQAKTVGYCLGKTDCVERSTALIHYLAQNCPDLRFIVRLHPGTDARGIARWEQLCGELGADFSDSRKEHPFEFLSRVDVVIAGGSGIILDAALMNVTPIMHELTPGYPDWYGFARDGLCPLCSTPDEMSRLLNELSRHRPPVRSLTKSYCETIDTAYEGRATELATSLIQQIGDGKAIQSSPWRRLENTGTLTAYEVTPG